MPTAFGPWSTVHNRFRQWRDAGVREALLGGLIAEAARRGEVDLSLASIDSTTVRAHPTLPGCTWAGTSSLPWRRLPQRRRRPAQRGQTRRTDRAENRDRCLAGRAQKHPAPTKAPAEDRPPQALQRRADQQGPPRRRPQVPPAGVHADRGPGCGQPAVHPRTGKGTGPSAAPAPVRTRLPGTRPTRPAATGITCAKRGIKAVIPEEKDQAANRKKKGSRGSRPVSHDAYLYKERNTVERLINELKAWQGIATRYDKPPTATSPASTCAPRRSGAETSPGPLVDQDSIRALTLVAEDEGRTRALFRECIVRIDGDIGHVRC